MAVDDLRDVDRLADAPVGCGVKDKVLQPVAAPLIEAQPQQRRAAVEGVPYKLRAAVLQKSTVAAAAAQRYRAGASGRVRLLGKGTVRALAQQLIAAAHKVGAGVLCRLQKQAQRSLPEQVVIVTEGDVLPARSLHAAVAGRADAGILLGDDVDAGVLARQRVAKPVRAVRRAVVDDDDLELRHLLGKDGFHGGAQGRLGIVRRDDHADLGHGGTSFRISHYFFSFRYNFP